MQFNEYMYVLSSCSQLEGPCQRLYRLGEQGLCQWEKITDMEELTVKVALYSCRRGGRERGRGGGGGRGGGNEKKIAES